MTWMTDRRARRSSDCFIALRYQLEHTRDQGGIEALALADEQGNAVATAGDARVCQELSAVAPLINRSFLGMPLPPALRGTDVTVRPVNVHGQELFLACCGGGVARDALLRSSVEGVARILTAN